jgi:hypothetical protein
MAIVWMAKVLEIGNTNSFYQFSLGAHGFVDT